MNQKIPIYLLESFVCAASADSFELAAKKLEITQSTLSKQMQHLELMLPHKLFTLSGRQKILTQYGQSMLEALLPKLNQTQEIIEQTNKNFETLENVKVRIAGRGEFLDLIANKLSTKNLVHLINMDNATALGAVLSRQIDLAIVHSTPDSSELIVKPFITSQFQLLLPKSNTVFKSTKPQLDKKLIDKLKTTPCLLYKENDTIIDSFRSSWGLNSNKLNVTRIYSHYSTLASMVHRGFGWAIVPIHINTVLYNTHAIPLNLGTSVEKKFYVCYRKENAKSIWLKNILSAIRSIS